MAKQHITNWLLRNIRTIKFNGKHKRLVPLVFLLFSFQSKSQVANYISNGSFEETYGCTWPNDLGKAKYWLGIDSANFGAGYFSACPNYDLVPLNGFTYQYPRSGIAYILSTWYLNSQPNIRSYSKNRLKKTLESGKIYCVKFYVNISNNSTHGIDGFGIYFGNSTVDTITKSNYALTYITPQIRNPDHNVIIDTLNWVAITGTFVANGTEKYAIIGNFKSDASTDTMLFNPTNLPTIGTDVLVDDVSCIPIDLPAFAGHDTTCIPGTSVYIGRQRDIGIDEACQWYQLPVTITPNTPAIGVAAGIWVSPTQTSTYVVRQEICGNVKWDTVVVYKDWVGFNTQQLFQGQLNLYPNPANDVLNFQYTKAKEGEAFQLVLFNQLGQMVREEELVFKNKQAIYPLADLPPGAYTVQLADRNGNTAHDKVVIAK